MRTSLAVCILASALISPVEGQKQVDPRNVYERIVCIVPMIGGGTYADPRRPLFAPAGAAETDAVKGGGIVSFSYQISDDGNFAVMELVARDRKVFAPILADRRPGIEVFERGKADRVAAEAAIRKHIKNFDLGQFGVRAH